MEFCKINEELEKENEKLKQQYEELETNYIFAVAERDDFKYCYERLKDYADACEEAAFLLFKIIDKKAEIPHAIEGYTMMLKMSNKKARIPRRWDD